VKDYIPDGGIPVNPAIDLTQFEPIAARLVEIAEGKGGKFVVVGIEAHTGRLSIDHIANDDKRVVFTLLGAAEKVARRPGWNTYVQQSLVREDLPANERGKEKHVTGVMALVLEFDAKHQPATRHDRLPVCPHAEVESSPGNFHCWYFLDRLYFVDEVKPVLAALVDKVGCDHCRSLEHLFRVPGTLNWPDQVKLKAGRSPTPVMAELTWSPEPALGDRISLDELKAAMIDKWSDVFTPPASSSSGKAEDFDWDQRSDNINARLNEGTIQKHLHACDDGTDRSTAAFCLMKLAKRCGHSPEEIVAMFLRYPRAPIVAHYKDEAHIRADVVRAFTKEDKRPSRDAGANKVFRLQDPGGVVPVREIKIIGGNLPANIDQAEAALLEQRADIFQRGTALVRPSLDEEITISKGRKIRGMRLVPIKIAGMREHMTAAADFRTYSAQEKDWRSVNCPKEIAEAYLEREGLWKVRHLSGTITTPTLRADGSILETPGYDEATGIFYHPGAEVCLAIPVRPSRREAEDALALLLDLIRETPFTSDASRSVMLSALLTVLVRRSLPTAPMHAFSAPVASSGKSYLVDLCSVLATGHEAPVAAQGGDESELEKRLGAMFMAGDQVISLDNCTRPLEGAFLCQVMTQLLVKPRILGKSKAPTLPTNAAMFATGNNLKIVGDMTRRVLRAEIDPGIEQPELRTFAHNPIAMVKGDRPRYVAAALTVLRAWLTAGKPQFTRRPGPLASFGEWSVLVRDALCWLGQADPCTLIEVSRAEDPDRNKLHALLEAWSAAIGEQRVTVKEVIAAAGIGRAENTATVLRDALKAVAAPFARTGDTVDPLRLGQYLGSHAGRVIDGLVIIREPKIHGKPTWRLEYRW
jgi:hypothetical protein